MIEKYSCYKFTVIPDDGVWIYKIFGEGCYPYDDGVIESNESFGIEQEARYAAIGHIVNLENGE